MIKRGGVVRMLLHEAWDIRRNGKLSDMGYSLEERMPACEGSYQSVIWFVFEKISGKKCQKSETHQVQFS